MKLGLGVMLAIGWTCLLPGCISMPKTDTGLADTQYRVDVAATQAERRILVTFDDRGIGRTVLGDPMLNYHRRGDDYTTSAFSERVVEQLRSDYGLVRVSDWPVTTLGVHCVVFEIGDGQTVPSVVEALSKDKRVGVVQSMRRFKVLSDPYSRLQPSLDSMKIQTAHRWSKGEGVTVAVIDTGVDVEHPDLKGQVVESFDVVGGSDDANAADIHGTAVAGVIAALADNDEGIVGVAPYAKLLAYRACWQERSDSPAAACDTFTLAKALNNAIAKRPQIINLSLTGPFDPLLTLLVKKALEENIAVVAAAGEADESGSGFPASVPGVIAVKAAEIESAPALTKVGATFTASGTKVLTTFPQHAYNFISGNSFAAAHVSGIVALVLAIKPGLRVSQLTTVLRSSLGADKQDHSLIDATSAVMCVQNSGTDCLKSS